MRRALLVAGCVLASWGAPAAAQVAELRPLHVITTESRATEPVAPGDSLRVRLHGKDLRTLADTLGASVANDGTVEYLLGDYPQMRAPERTWLEATFMIDHDEPVFGPLREELASEGQEVTRATIVEFVSRSLTGSLERDWDLASVVARRREGDCTEYAVFTAALARLHGIPSRVVVGLALVTDGRRRDAFGHAWAETLEAGE